MTLPRSRIPENQNVLFPIQKPTLQQRFQLPGCFRQHRLTSKFCRDFSSGSAESFNNRCTLDFPRCWHFREITSIRTSNSLDENLRELRPHAGRVSLQLDAAFLQVFELIVFQHGIAVDPDQAVPALYHELKRKPDLRLDLGIDRAFERVERSGGIVRALDVVELDLVMPAAQALTTRTKQDAAVVVLHVPYVKLQLEIPELLPGRQVPGAVGVNDLADRPEQRLAFRDIPFVEIFATAVERLPLVLRRQL